MRIRTVALICLAIAAGACDRPESAGRPPPPPPEAGVSATLTVHDGTGAAGPFRLADLSRLTLDASYTAPRAGSRSLRIDVISPRGVLYAQLPMPIDATGGAASQISRFLEVRGTPIETYQQTGKWRFRLVEGEGAPLATVEIVLE